MSGATARVTTLPAPSHPDDSSLISRVLRDGDRWAQESLYRRHVHRVTTVVGRLLRHGPDIEDVVQDAFVEAFRDLAKLREPELFERWLLRIAVHKVHRRFRRRRLRRALGLDDGRDDERLAQQARIEASQEARAELALLDAALDSLSGAERTCWVLRCLEGYQLAEVAELVGCSLATAKRRVARAQAHVAKHFEETSHA